MEDKKGFLVKHFQQGHFGILTPREQKVLRAHYGYGGPVLTLKEIGENIFGVTKETIRLIEKKAITKLEKYDFSRDPEFWAKIQRENEKLAKDSRSGKSAG